MTSETYYNSPGDQPKRPKRRPSRPNDPVKPTGKLVTRKGSSNTKGAGVDVYKLPPIKKKYRNFPGNIYPDPQDPMRVKNFK